MTTKMKYELRFQNGKFSIVKLEPTSSGNGFVDKLIGEYDGEEETGIWLAAQVLKLNHKNPIWISLDGGDTFEGHQGHWADCFFSNAIESTIRSVLDNDELFPGCNTAYVIREMTDEEVERCPEALAFREWLIEKYGEC